MDGMGEMKWCFIEIGNALERKNLEEAQRLISKYNSDNLTVEQQVEMLFYCGMYSFEMGQIEQSEDYYLKCIRLCEENKIKVWAGLYYELSLVCFKKYNVGNENIILEQSILFCKKAIRLALEEFSLSELDENGYKSGTSEFYIPIVMHLGVLYQALEEYEKSIEILLLCKTVFKHIYNLDYLGIVYDELGTSYALSGNQTMAYYYYYKSVIIKLKNGNKKGMHITFEHMVAFLDLKVADKKQIQRLYRMCVEELA